MSAVARICVSCSKLFTPASTENTICIVGRSMLDEFYECDECISKAEYELPTNENALAGAVNTPRARTPIN
jgi:hypothetical protein